MLVAVDMIEADCQLTRKLKMLGLVFSDRDVCCAIEKDVGGLEDGVGEEAELESFFIRWRRIEGRGGF